MRGEGTGGREPAVRWAPRRALLRLKPSRICDSMGHNVRYGVPHLQVNALRARLFAGVRGWNPRRRIYLMGNGGQQFVSRSL